MTDNLKSPDEIYEESIHQLGNDLSNKKREIKFRAWDMRNSEMHYQFEIGAGNGLSFFEGRATQYWTLMQSTELKDIKGKYIFEGDIVTYKNNPQKNNKIDGVNIILLVVWTGGGFFLDGFSNSIGWQIENMDIEVVGNIYENPELLNDNNSNNY